jgi:diketogulonate reductase-like aldo/keto reductase
MMDLLRHEAYFAFNQVEFHPHLNQKLLLEFCSLNHVQLVAYRPLGKSKILLDPVIAFLAKKYQKSEAQIVLRWLLEKNIPAIPKASCREHLRENLDIFAFSLTKEDGILLDAAIRN